MKTGLKITPRFAALLLLQLAACDPYEALVGRIPADAGGGNVTPPDISIPPPPDLTGCQAPKVLRYEQPGCGPSAPAPKCGSAVMDMCARTVCSCAGKVLVGCDFYGEPWSRNLPFPNFKAGDPCDPNEPDLMPSATGCVLDGGAPSGRVDGWVTDPTSPNGHPCTCGLPEGPVLPIGNLATARALLPDRWLACYRSTEAIGPWMPANFVGIEFTRDDKFYFLESGPGGAIQRSPGFPGGGTLAYNPLPPADFEEIGLNSGGQGDLFYVSFEGNPRKMRMLGRFTPLTAYFVPLAP